MYKPSQKILEKYADLLVNFALNSGKGVKKGEVVMVIMEDNAKPLLLEVHESLLKAGAIPLIKMLPSGTEKTFFELANEEQLKFFPKKYLQERANLIDHQIGVIATDDPMELKSIDPEKIFLSMDSKKKYREWLEAKENKGKFTWVIGLYGTSKMAKEAKMTLEEYWEQIIHACYLDKKDPKIEWQRILSEQERIKKNLNSMDIEWLKIDAKNIDLKVQIGPNRKWLGGSGRNIPSYEIFISPDCRGTEGFVYFNEPLYRYGNLIKDIRLEFKKGKVIKAEAKHGEKFLENMIKRKNANMIGEFSLTDKRFSRISKFMANTLFDENIGGKYGNMHLAVGLAYKDSYTGDPSKPSKIEWQKMGFNQSPEHTDIVNTEDKTVTAILKNGKERLIYKSGEFQV